MALEVPISKIKCFGDEIVRPNLPGGVDSPRIVTIRSVNNLGAPGVLAGGPPGNDYEGFNVGF
jgi:hypothetical protein